MLIELLLWILLAVLAIWIGRKITKAHRRRRRRHGARDVTATRAKPDVRMTPSLVPDRREPRLTRWPKEFQAEPEGTRPGKPAE